MEIRHVRTSVESVQVRGVQTANRRNSRSRSSRRSHAREDRTGEEPPPTPSPGIPSLQASVLVLNRLYMAIHVVNVRRAIALLYRDLAEVIHPENGERNQPTFANHSFDSWREVSQLRAELKGPDEDWIRAVNFQLQVPRVIRLFSFDRLPRQKLHLTRRTVLARDGNYCQYCGRQFPGQQLSLDHVTPRSRGGKTTWENVVCACLRCNIKKGGRTPHEARMRLIRRPAKPNGNPILALKLDNPKYASWRTWLNGVHWDLGFRV